MKQKGRKREKSHRQRGENKRADPRKRRWIKEQRNESREMKALKGQQRNEREGK